MIIFVIVNKNELLMLLSVLTIPFRKIWNKIKKYKMPRFHAKKTSLMEDQKSVVFKGKVIEGPINKGMDIEIPITDAASIKMKIFDIVHFEKQRDENKKVGLIVDFDEEPEALDIVLSLNIANETLECL